MIQEPQIGESVWAFSGNYHHHRATEYFVRAVHTDFIVIHRPRSASSSGYKSHRQVNRDEIFKTLDELIQDLRDYARPLPQE